jgi:hypothetical protein
MTSAVPSRQTTRRPENLRFSAGDGSRLRDSVAPLACQRQNRDEAAASSACTPRSVQGLGHDGGGIAAGGEGAHGREEDGLGGLGQAGEEVARELSEG